MSMCAELIVLEKLPTLPEIGYRQAVTTLLCDTIPKRDFALPIVSGASKMLDRSVDIMWRRFYK